MSEIKAGDVVQVKSGGPPMTVETVGDYNGTPTAWCKWFDGTKEKEGTFALVAIQHIPPTTPPVGLAVKRRNPLAGNRMFAQE